MSKGQFLHSFSIFLTVVPHQSKLTVTNFLNGNGEARKKELGFLKLFFGTQFLVLHFLTLGTVRKIKSGIWGP